MGKFYIVEKCALEIFFKTKYIYNSYFITNQNIKKCLLQPKGTL